MSSFRLLTYFLYILYLFSSTVFAEGEGPSYDSEYFDLNVALERIDAMEPRVEAFQGVVEENLEDWAEWDPGDTPFMFGSPKPEINYELDYSWLSGNIPPVADELVSTFSTLDASVPIPYFYRQYGNTYFDIAQVDAFSFASQTAQCNRMDFPKTHLHTYEALRTPPMRYSSLPRSSWFFWDAPVGLGVPELPPVIDQLVNATDYISAITPGYCCAKLGFDFGWDGVDIECEEYHTCLNTNEYQPLRHDELGYPAGWCADIDTTPPWLWGVNFPDIGIGWFETCCPYRARFGHVVDYYFPTQKVSMSRQPFQSRYLRMNDVLDANEGQLKKLKDSLHAKSLASSGGLRMIDEVNKKLKQPVYESLLPSFHTHFIAEEDPLAEGYEPPNINMNPDSLSDLIAQRGEFLNFQDQFKNLMVFSKGKNDRGFIRFLQEKQVEQDILSRHYAPHVYPTNDGEVGQPFYATDFQFDPWSIMYQGEESDQNWGFEMAYWLYHSETHDDVFRKYQSGEDWDTSEVHSEMPHLDHPERCARNNAQSIHTPEDLLLNICPQEEDADGNLTDATPNNPYCKSAWSKLSTQFDTPSNDFNSTRCLKDVGEIVWTSKTRKTNTDYVFQTLAKGYQQYHKKFPHSHKSVSLDLSKDRFHFLPAKSLNEINYADIKDLGSVWRGAAAMNSVFPAELNKKLNEDVRHGDTGVLSFLPFASNFLGGHCDKFDELDSSSGGKKHWEYQTANSIDEQIIGSHGETNMEVFTLFSGCYGYPGYEEWTLDVWDVINIDFIARLLPSEFGPFGNLRVR